MNISNVAEKIAGLEFWPRTGLALSPGGLSALALPPFHLVPVLVISFCVLVWLLDGAADGPAAAEAEGAWCHVRRAAWLGWVFGFGFFLAGLYWVGAAFLVDADQFAWMIPFVAVLFPGGLALFSAAALALARGLWSRGPERVLTLAAAWAALEWLRGHILTGFPWNLVGYTWAGGEAVAQSTSVIGIYGLSLVTVAVAASPAVVAGPGAPRPRRWLWPALALTALAVIWAGGVWRLAAHPTRFVEGVVLRLVQPSIPQADKWRPENRRAIFDRYLALTRSAGLERVSHVIWPETALPLVLTDSPVALDEIAKALGAGRVLIVGSVDVQREAAAGSVKLFNALHVIRVREANKQLQSIVMATYNKHHLVPFGEYMPLQTLMEWIGLKQLTVGSGDGFTAGPGLRTLPVPGAPAVAPLICYEAIFPGAVLEPGTSPGWIVNVTNDAWFGDTSGPRQHLAMARMRAIETGLPLVRSANTGISAIIDAFGRITQRLDLNRAGILDGPLPAPADRPLYRKWGDAVFWGLVLACALLGLAGRGAASRRHS